MKKADFVALVAEKAGISQVAAGKAVNAFAEAVKEVMANDDSIILQGFGTFEVRNRDARTCRNPRTGETLKVAACKAPAFKASKALKDALN